MTDKTKVYVNPTDGKWYSWTGTEWSPGGVYQSTAIGEHAVTPKNTTFFEYSNVIQDETYTNGIRQPTKQGGFEKGNTRAVSDNIVDIFSGDTLTIHSSLFNYTLHYYDSLGNWLSGGDTWMSQDLLFTENKRIRLQFRYTDNRVFNISDVDVPTIFKIGRPLLTKKYLPTIEVEGSESKIVDLVMFMGQSNMAGRGVADEAPIVPDGWGYEFRAIYDPTQLHALTEPFGVDENKSGGISEGSKTGSMVSAFVNEYYKLTKIPIVEVSASRGGSAISEWQPGTSYLNDAIDRFDTAQTWLEDNDYIIRHQYMVWNQGETDGDRNTSKEDYIIGIETMVDEMVKESIEKCFVVRNGNHRDNESLYNDIIQAQTEFCKTNKNAVLVSSKFDKMASDGLMKDVFHYTQEGYNIAGKNAGMHTAYFINNHKEPTMYDWENDSLYYSYK